MSRRNASALCWVLTIAEFVVGLIFAWHGARAAECRVWPLAIAWWLGAAGTFALGLTMAGDQRRTDARRKEYDEDHKWP